MIGIIIPPKEIKALVETTALWVAENGANFVDFIIQKSKNDVKFAFLNNTHPYRRYFDTMVDQYTAKLNPTTQPKQQSEENVKKEEPQTLIETGANQEQKQFLERVFKEVKVPDPDIYYTEIPEKLTLLDIDIIQHTAQYVAKNGKKFLDALSQREKSNPQFEFLKSTSSNYKYFMSLIEGYNKILAIKTTEIDNYPLLQEDKYDLIIKCSEKYEYEQSQQKLNKAKKVTMEVQEDNIDWNDFELVETIQFEDEYEDSSKNATTIDHLTQLMRRKLTNPISSGIKPIESIISVGTKPKQIMQLCASCGKSIPVSQINLHIKACMLDPKQKARRTELQNKKVMAGEQVDIHSNINSMLNRTSEVNKINAIFDGQNPNITRTTGSIAMMENEKRKLNQSLQKNQKK